MEKLYYKLKWWLRYDAKYTHKYLANGIKNLWRWFPIIWKDRDWDDYYIWILLEKKLTYQAKYIKNRGIHLDAERDAERMITCVRLIQRVRDEYYHMEHMDYHKSEYHWDEVVERPGNKQLRIEEISENYDDYFKKYPLVYKKIVNTLNKNQKKSKSLIAIRMSWENHHRARKLLFKIMESYIESWWD